MTTYSYREDREFEAIKVPAKGDNAALEEAAQRLYGLCNPEGSDGIYEVTHYPSYDDDDGDGSIHLTRSTDGHRTTRRARPGFYMVVRGPELLNGEYTEGEAHVFSKNGLRNRCYKRKGGKYEFKSKWTLDAVRVPNLGNDGSLKQAVEKVNRLCSKGVSSASYEATCSPYGRGDGDGTLTIVGKRGFDNKNIYRAVPGSYVMVRQSRPSRKAGERQYYTPAYLLVCPEKEFEQRFVEWEAPEPKPKKQPPKAKGGRIPRQTLNKQVGRIKVVLAEYFSGEDLKFKISGVVGPQSVIGHIHKNNLYLQTIFELSKDYKVKIRASNDVGEVYRLVTYGP